MSASNPFYTQPNSAASGSGFYTSPFGPSALGPGSTGAAAPGGLLGAAAGKAQSQPPTDLSITAGSPTSVTPGLAGNPTSPTTALGSQYTNPVRPSSVGPTTPTTGPLSGPGYNESWYAQHGNDLSGPTNTQKLFDQGAAGSNPFYENAMNQTDKSINAAENARGNWNSSAALGTIGMANADIMGQQAHELDTLGTSADTANTNQFMAGSNASNTAQNSTQGRINGGITANMNLDTAQANMVDNFYKMAQDGSLTADMASIEAQLQASGVDAATAQALTNDILTAGGIGAKAATGK